jgi:hypothetical protein
MNKPFTVVYEDFKQELANLINNSNLPALVIEPILQNYLIEIKNVAKKQYLLDKEKYEESLKEVKKNEKKD